jgi:phosphoribosylpyrophosphate synthetase
LGLEKDNRLQMVTMVKKRGKDGNISEMESNIPVPDKVCIIIDDIIDTAGTLMKAVSMLKHPRIVETGVVTVNPDGTTIKQNVTLKGASKVYAIVTHALLNDKPPTKDKDGTIATELVMNEDLEELVVTNSVYLGDKPTHCPKMKVLDITEMFSQAIVLNQEGKSTKPLFDPLNYSKSIDWYLRYTGKIIGESPDHPHLLSSESEMNLLAFRQNTHRHTPSITTLIDEDDSEVQIDLDFVK